MHAELAGQDNWVHSTLLASPDRVPYGLIGQQIWERSATTGSKKKNRKKKPIEDKESYKWLVGIRHSAAAQEELGSDGPSKGHFQEVVCVADRESDVFDTFVEAQKQGVKLLIRATQDRRIAEDETQKLWDFVTNQACEGQLRVEVKRNGDREAREAVAPRRATFCDVRYAAVTLQPPQNRSKSDGLTPISINVIHVIEVSQPVDGSPAMAPKRATFEWLLLTTLPLTDFEQACEKWPF